MTGKDAVQVAVQLMEKTYEGEPAEDRAAFDAVRDFLLGGNEDQQEARYAALMTYVVLNTVADPTLWELIQRERATVCAAVKLLAGEQNYRHDN